jgi:hypothetical protein
MRNAPAMPPEAEFAAALLDPARAVPEGYAPAAPDRFRVYRNNVTVGLVDALAATYPAVQALVGETFFRAAAREAVRANPPRSPVLIDYGGFFPDFLAGFPPAASLPYLADVARLEWAWTRAYNAADAAPAPVSILGDVAPEALSGARLVAHPSLRLVASRYPVVTIWAETTGRIDRAKVDMRRAETALILRPALQVSVRAMAPGEAAFLVAILDGAPIGAAAEAATAAAPEFDLGAAFVSLFGAGAFTGLVAR